MAVPPLLIAPQCSPVVVPPCSTANVHIVDAAAWKKKRSSMVASVLLARERRDLSLLLHHMAGCVLCALRKGRGDASCVHPNVWGFG